MDFITDITINSSTKLMSTTSSSMTASKTSTVQSNSITVIIAIGVSIAILLLLSTTLIITVVVLTCSYKRRSAKQKLNTDSLYSSLSRGTEQQVPIQHDSAELYDQIHLSPSTGQTEFIPKHESENINYPDAIPQNSHTTNSTADDDTVQSSALNVAYQATTSQLPTQKAHKSTCEQPTYAAVDKNKKKNLKKQTKKEDSKHKTAEKGPPVSPYKHEVSSSAAEGAHASPHKDLKQDNVEKHEIDPPHTIEELYTAVKKKPKGSVPKDEEETPSIPPHTVEELYTAVVKKPKSNSAEKNKEEAPPIPPQTDEEMHTAKEKPSPHTIEDLYTAVVKQPKENSTTDDTDSEAAPPLPPHTVEELYTAVQKKPKGSVMEDEGEAPPIPPHTVEDTY